MDAISWRPSERAVIRIAGQNAEVSAGAELIRKGPRNLKSHQPFRVTAASPRDIRFQVARGLCGPLLSPKSTAKPFCFMLLSSRVLFVAHGQTPKDRRSAWPLVDEMVRLTAVSGNEISLLGATGV